MRLATCWTCIPLSSHQLGFLHLIIHVRYVKGQTMLIRCYFAIIVMVDTISSASSQSSLKFALAIGTIHHVFLQHLDSYSDHATLFLAQVWGGDTWEFHLSLLLCIVYICVCMHFFLVDYFIALTSFGLFGLVEFTMDLHPYNTVHHDTTCHDSYHAHTWPYTWWLVTGMPMCTFRVNVR